MAGPLLRLDDVGLAYHSRRGIQAVLQHISFSLAQGEHLTVSGPSGCGKSTLLRLIAGLQAPTEGQIYFAGQKMTAPRPDLAIVFQDYGLFPWKTVEENILLPGRLHGSPLDKDQLASLLDTLGLTAVRHHYPGELSGGQKQRTALGRAMGPCSRSCCSWMNPSQPWTRTCAVNAMTCMRYRKGLHVASPLTM